MDRHGDAALPRFVVDLGSVMKTLMVSGSAVCLGTCVVLDALSLSNDHKMWFFTVSTMWNKCS